MTVLWTIDAALPLVRLIEAECASAGWHVGLAGGVLHSGESDHDLDVIVYPRQRTTGARRPRYQELCAALRRAGLKRRMTHEELTGHWRRKGLRDRKWVEVWMKGARRVDLLVLS